MQTLILATSLFISNPVNISDLEQQQIEITTQATQQVLEINKQILRDSAVRLNRQMYNIGRLTAKTSETESQKLTREAE